MANIFKSIQETMAAAAFAEAGEHETAREFLSQSKNAHKKILLGTDKASLAPKAISYALNVCSRLGAGLEVVRIFRFSETRANAEAGDELKETLAQQGIPYEAVYGKAGLGEEIVRYAAERRDILLLILSLAERNENLKKPDKALVKRFHCPVVFLEDQVTA